MEFSVDVLPGGDSLQDAAVFISEDWEEDNHGAPFVGKGPKPLFWLEVDAQLPCLEAGHFPERDRRTGEGDFPFIRAVAKFLDAFIRVLFKGDEVVGVFFSGTGVGVNPDSVLAHGFLLKG